MKFSIAYITASFAPLVNAGNQCCYSGHCGGEGCNPPENWCSFDQDNCEKSCRGKFCPDKPPAPPPPPGPPVPPPPPPPAPPTPPAPPAPACGTPVGCHGALKKKGNRIVDKNDQNVKLTGLSMFWSNWAGAFWNADVVHYLASEWNVNLIRCAMGVSNDGGPVGGGYLSNPDGQKALVSTVVDAAIDAGIYVIIDWHVEGRCDAAQSKPFFSEMAQKYADKPNIIWETCNEPHGWSWGDGLKAYHEQVIPVIREHSSNLIVAGTNTWSQDDDEASRDQLSDSNVAYTLHFYSSMHKQGNRDKASTAMANGAAIFVTEWGVEQNNEGHAETETWMNFLRQNSLSSAMWGIYDKDSEAWAIVKKGANPKGGWSDSDLTDTGRYIKKYFLAENPKPTPTPPPSPPSPPPQPVADTWCPSAGDFVVAYGKPVMKDGGWENYGNGGVATKSAFNLLGGWVEFDIDLSSVQKGVNANIYTISPSISASGYVQDNYCDGAGQKPWCVEVDWLESNGNCGGATTLHTKPGPGNDGCTAWGCRNSYHYNGKATFHMRIEYGADGSWTTIRDGQVINAGNMNPSPGGADWAALKSAYESKGAVIYSSEWTGWVPVEDCGSGGDLESSHFSISNLKIKGQVVQGPKPRACSSASFNGTLLVV